ncbi:hypothetical protein [Pseudomonas fulva]|nr:hypothetical protein [Pseudomonas fulva]MBF8781555.1 hypothetical protein [Pseudomonas fulva]
MTKLERLWWLFFFGAPFLITGVSLGIEAYIACSRHFEVLLKSLSGSRAVPRCVAMCGTAGLKARISLIAMLSTFLLWPRHFIRKGWLSEVDYKLFPAKLKFWINFAACLNIVAGVWLLLTYVVIKLFR